MHSVRYSRETVARLAEDGMRPAAIAAHLDADYDRVARDIRAVRASGRSIPGHGSGPLPRAGRPCPGDEVVRLARDSLRACDIAAKIGHPATNVNYHLRVARRAGELPLTTRSKPGPDKQTPARWTGAEGFPPAAEVADQVVALGLDRGLPVHEVFRMLFTTSCRCPEQGWMPKPRTASVAAMERTPGDLSLILPDLAYASSYLAARAEGYTDSSVPGADQAQLSADQLAEHIAALNDPARGVRWADGPDSPPIPFTHLWLVSALGLFLGRCSVRYELSAKLRMSGGHIGYEIRPGCRGRGLGHRALQLGMEHIRGRKLTELLLTCRADNAASIRVIETAGGVLEDTIPHHDIPGAGIRRYWIGRPQHT